MKRTLFLLLIFNLFCYTNGQSKIADGLIAYYPFNGDIKDYSGNNNDAIDHNTTFTVDRFGKNGCACEFNGYSSYLSIPNKAELNPANISIAAWVQVESFYSGDNGGNYIVSKGNDGNYGHYGLLYLSEIPKIQGIIGGVGLPHIGLTSNSVMKENQWIHLCTTYDGEKFKLFVNGELDSEILANENYYLGCNAEDLYIGKNHHPIYPYWLGAKLDEVRIYNRALTDDEVFALFEFKGDGITTNTSIEQGANKDIKLWPLPAKDYIYVDFGKTYSDGNYSYKIIDAYGRAIKSSMINNKVETIRFSTETSAQIYYIYVMDSQMKFISGQKFIVK
jgi:hypothetical protein